MKPKNTPTTEEVFELTIESLSYSGGRGVGRHEGVVVFVPDTAPGDRVRVQITARKPRFLEGRIIEILEPGSGRRQPPCPYFGRCGGCSWQHVEYPVQVAQKEKILRDALRKIARTSPIHWLPFVKAENEFSYRNRIQIQVRDKKFGFFSRGSRNLVAIDSCRISEGAINARMQTLSNEELSAARLELALRRDGSVAVMADRRDPEEALFSQVNTVQNSSLIRAMLEAIHLQPSWIMDLYAGSGNLTEPLRTHFPAADLTAFELSRASVERGKTLLPGVEWYAGDVGKVLRKLRQPNGDGLIVIDPPRTGCERDVVEQLVRLKPSQIVYISCNPTTFARDVERLLSDGGYVLESVQGLDMFPQTEHVELISSLRAAPLLTSKV